MIVSMVDLLWRPQLSWIEYLASNQGVGRSNRSGRAIRTRGQHNSQPLFLFHCYHIATLQVNKALKTAIDTDNNKQDIRDQDRNACLRYILLLYRRILEKTVILDLKLETGGVHLVLNLLTTMQQVLHTPTFRLFFQRKKFSERESANNHFRSKVDVRYSNRCITLGAFSSVIQC